MRKINVTVNGKTYLCKVAENDEDRLKGLLGVKELNSDEGMFFDFKESKEVSMWMKDTLIPLDIIYINEDLEVIYVYKACPKDETKVGIQDTRYVLEIGPESGVLKGDEVIIPDDEFDESVMKVLNPDGTTLMSLWGGERIVSRRETKILINKAKKAKSDSDLKALGRYMFKVIKGLDTRPAEYVKSE